MSAAPQNQFVTSLRLFVDIARMRRGPEDLPVSASLLATTVIASYLLSVGCTLLLPDSSAEIAGPLLVDVLLSLVGTAVVLRIARRPERFLQTATAMFGFHLVLVPVSVLVQALLGHFGEVPSWQLPLTLLVIGLGGWMLAVGTRIISSATGWPLLVCIALLLVQELLIWRVLVLLFPEYGAAAATAA